MQDEISISTKKNKKLLITKLNSLAYITAVLKP